MAIKHTPPHHSTAADVQDLLVRAAIDEDAEPDHGPRDDRAEHVLDRHVNILGGVVKID